MTLRPVDEEAEFLSQSCHTEHDKGLASPLLTKYEVDNMFGEGQWCPIPTFVIKQDNGKTRRIDNGRRGGRGHNSAIAYTERLRMISPFQPAVCARVLAHTAIYRRLELDP